MRLSTFRAAILPILSGIVGFAAGSLPALANESLTATDFNPYNFAFPAGVYHCELNRNVDVREVSPDLTSATLHFNNKEYRLKAVRARTGALRYEDPQAGVVWLVITGKSMLLDTRHGKQLANECRA